MLFLLPDRAGLRIPYFPKNGTCGSERDCPNSFFNEDIIFSKKKKKKPFGSGSVQNVVIKGGLWRD